MNTFRIFYSECNISNMLMFLLQIWNKIDYRLEMDFDWFFKKISESLILRFGDGDQ